MDNWVVKFNILCASYALQLVELLVTDFCSLFESRTSRIPPELQVTDLTKSTVASENAKIPEKVITEFR